MPQPTPSDAHVNAPLTNISVAYVQKQSHYVADTVFPFVGVQKQSDLYYKFSKEDFLRDEAKPRAPSTESAGGGFAITTGSYACVVEAFHKDVDDQLRANADSVLQLDRAATEFATQKLMIRKERRWVNSYFKTGVWGTDLTPGTLWSAASGATPRANIETAKAVILANTGFEANVLTLGYRVFAALRTCPEIVDQFKYTSADSIDEQMMARFFNVDKVVVAKAIYTAGNEGAASPVTDFVAGKHALLTYSAPSPSLMQPTAGYNFGWTGFAGAAGGIRTKRFRMEHLASDRIECEMAYDMKVIVPEMGYFFNTVVS